MRSAQLSKKQIEFDKIPTPKMIAIVEGNGSGSKLFQSFIDNHEQIYMIPAYPLLYYYPHWESWEKKYKDSWNWETIINLFCEKHASVIDSRAIPGHNGLTKLGVSQEEHIQIDEDKFRCYLFHFVNNKPVHRRTFLLSIHYAYALCNNEDISKKKVLIYHVHTWEYLIQYLAKDFPEVRIIAMTRDARPNIERRVKAGWNVDDAKLNKTDALIYRNRVCYQVYKFIIESLNELKVFSKEQIKVVKHEELGTKLEQVMHSVADFIGIDFTPSMLEITFGGKLWWGDKIYDMKPMNIVNPRVLSQEWKKTISKIDWFVIEGILFDYLQHYNYKLYLYTKDTFLNRFILLLSIFIPTYIERSVFLKYLDPKNHIKYLSACFSEATGHIKLKDYTWNATYLFKYTYLDLRLWRPRWYASSLYIGKKISKKQTTKFIDYFIIQLSRITYIFVNYGRFWLSIITCPIIILKRITLCLSFYLKRIKKSLFLPEMIQ